MFGSRLSAPRSRRIKQTGRKPCHTQAGVHAESAKAEADACMHVPATLTTGLGGGAALSPAFVQALHLILIMVQALRLILM